MIISMALTPTEWWILFPDEKDDVVGLDALGEIVNILGGSLFGNKNFRTHFGSLRASVPVFKDRDIVDGKSCNVRGVLIVESVKLFLALAVNVSDSGSLA